jgi:hypothetical protein
MSLSRSLVSLSFFVALAACGQIGAPAGAGDAAQNAQNGQSTQIAQSAPPSSCDSPAMPMALGAQVSGEIAETGQPYPANARYYCVNIPAGVNSVTMELSGMSVDLDLYVGHGNIASVQGVDLQRGETYEWKSNAFGTGAERVVITDPQPGIYYAEIVSYEGRASSYQFSAR